MKRAVQSAFPSFFSSPPIPKRSRANSHDMTVVMSHLDSLERLQYQLLEVEKNCAKEQLAIQRKYDTTMRLPLILLRHEQIESIPQFWCIAIMNHPGLDGSVLKRLDYGPLSYLTKLDVEDNLDDNGSFRITLIFDDSNNPYFSNNTLVRTVTVLDDQTEHPVSTPIAWAPKMKPDSHPESFFTWFASNDDSSSFSHIICRDLWMNPYMYYLGLSVGDSCAQSEEDVDLKDRTRTATPDS